ncbi:PLDc N-terminal domain-containing protein [Clavibacter sp. VKM Ac-2873]|uniref:PLDc N-terminal domain-containing protein n=1 Tax=Clavibacter sp. VKM Ac-2873 TaxID=2783813 RepID=UPI00188C012E|nr:PLDc N-terminal domain-containing protein [Clavibacter sp. VKM Ac-2873]MBF4619362.1 PLDc N-terminal domain-containing protein [Clavibacter sp. VKM Ac-2873]
MSDSLVVGVVVAPLVIAHVALVVTALVQVVRDRTLAGLSRDLWIAALVIVPILGAIVWFGAGHRTVDAQRAVQRVRLGL